MALFTISSRVWVQTPSPGKNIIEPFKRAFSKLRKFQIHSRVYVPPDTFTPSDTPQSLHHTNSAPHCQ